MRMRPRGWAADGSPERSVVLLAEDDDALRALVASELRRDGHTVLEARDGHQFAFHVESSLFHGEAPPGVVITDVHMPGWTGLDVLQDVRASDWSTPVIVMTAFGDPATRAEARRLGAAAVLDKPLDLTALRTLVRELLGAEASPRG